MSKTYSFGPDLNADLSDTMKFVPKLWGQEFMNKVYEKRIYGDVLEPPDDWPDEAKAEALKWQKAFDEEAKNKEREDFYEKLREERERLKQRRESEAREAEYDELVDRLFAPRERKRAKKRKPKKPKLKPIGNAKPRRRIVLD